jgi:hypothetical protein
VILTDNSIQKKAPLYTKKTHEALEVLRSFVPDDRKVRNPNESFQKKNITEGKCRPPSRCEEGHLVEYIVDRVNDLVVHCNLIMQMGSSRELSGTANKPNEITSMDTIAIFHVDF